MPNKLERFTEDAREALAAAEQEAEALKHNFIGPDHLLIGLLQGRTDIASRVLRGIGIDVAQAREAITSMPEVFQRQSQRPPELSEDLKQTIELAIDEARLVGQSYIGSEHLLLGLLRLQGSEMNVVVQKLITNPAMLRRQIRRLMGTRAIGLQTAEPRVETAADITSTQKMARFSQRARRALSLAQEEAERLEHSYIGPEHILLALLHEEGGVAARVLFDLGIDLSRTRILVERQSQAGPRQRDTRLNLSADTRKLLELAVDEAVQMGHQYVGTEHLLIGLSQQPEGITQDILRQLNVTPDEILGHTRRLLETASEEASPGRGSLAMRPATAGQGPLSSYNRMPWRAFLHLADLDARRLGHSQVGPEHLLLALVTSDEDRAGYVLRNLGVRYESVLSLVGKPVPEVHELVNQLEFSPELITVLGYAVKECYRPGNVAAEAKGRSASGDLRSEHLLLGLLDQGANRAIEILRQLNISPEDIRKVIVEALG